MEPCVAKRQLGLGRMERKLRGKPVNGGPAVSLKSSTSVRYRSIYSVRR